MLARWQAEHVQALLLARGHEARIQLITTTGDRVQDRRLESVGGKGAFLKEIEEAMLAGEVELAVHSLKDVPTALPAGLRLCAILPACGEGISTVALAVSISTMGWLSATRWPVSTSQVATVASSKPSPRSGSMNCVSVAI